ncbi:putative nuclease HARBI1 [Strongylocentrotus purpuratus]|uniref:Putative nuclease HARBI1 n=1 Tax=Strongylocentrotus purpuratus TaxID=7668 RepID=A0A7M7NWR0_STRPU|nr:putative nuclease HARBI1 [Strongylocentrotus purpuratus]
MALRFYATGSFYAVTGDLQGVSKASVSRVVRDISRVLVREASNYIVFPRDRASLLQVKRGFTDMCGIPNTLGAVDCTHVRIRSPSIDEHLFVNRKGYHSINIQCICDSQMKFLNVLARFPGSSHDSYIWANSGICRRFEDVPVQGHLLGDSGYPLRPFLLTPLLNPTTRPEERYNQSHKRGRSVIERSFGVLKSRFRCIDVSGGGLQFSPERVCHIFVAVAVLHNICVTNNLPYDEPIVPHLDDNNHDDVHAEIAGDGRRTRNNLIEQLYGGRD